MSQVTVNDEPGQAYAGKVHSGGQLPSSIASYVASELIYFGKLVIVADADLAVGGAAGGPQTCALPASAADVLRAAQAGGIAIADPSVERMRDPATPNIANSAPYGAFGDEASVPVMRMGKIWVQTETAITALSNGVFIRVSTPGIIPIASLGSFGIVDDADTEPAPAGMAWAGSATVDGIFLGLLSVNLPA
jgi:hypothetical protein